MRSVSLFPANLQCLLHKPEKERGGVELTCNVHTTSNLAGNPRLEVIRQGLQFRILSKKLYGSPSEQLQIFSVIWVLLQYDKPFKNGRKRKIPAGEVIVRVVSNNNRKANGDFEEKISLLGCQFSPITSSQKNWRWVGLETSNGLGSSSLTNNINCLSHSNRYR